jgi:hypothetical protein
MISGLVMRPFLFVVAIGLSFLAPVVAAADGGKAKNAIYEASVPATTGSGSLDFRVDTSPIIFYLGTVNNKYHVLLVRVMNHTHAPLKLTKDQDTVELQFSDGQSVKGMLNLPAVDHATWDGLETEIRKAVAYPEAVEPGEEEGIYLYVPVGDVSGPRKQHRMPSSITYNIKSLAAPIALRPRAAAAKA